jgi:hypothetical protein
MIQKRKGVRLLGPKIALGATSAITIATIIYSHYSQVRDKKVMREGVERDKERIKMKKKMIREQHNGEYTQSDRTR